MHSSRSRETLTRKPKPVSLQPSSGGYETLEAQLAFSIHRPLSSSFLGLPYGILNINHKAELFFRRRTAHVSVA